MINQSKERRKIRAWFLRLLLKKNNFTVVSHNCWGAEVYRELGLSYQTPFVGLFLYPVCFLKLVGNLEGYLRSELAFTQESKYPSPDLERRKYPVGLLGGEVEIHFLHYKSETEAREKWKRRMRRMDSHRENIFFMMSERDGCTPAMIKNFDAVDFQNKVCFTARNYPEIRSSVWIKECQNESCVPDGAQLYQTCKKYFDVINWLNTGSGRVGFQRKLLNILKV